MIDSEQIALALGVGGGIALTLLAVGSWVNRIIAAIERVEDQLREIRAEIEPLERAADCLQFEIADELRRLRKKLAPTEGEQWLALDKIAREAKRPPG